MSRGLDCPKCGAALDITAEWADPPPPIGDDRPTLRDEFAMAALIGIKPYFETGKDDVTITSFEDGLAAYAYRIADAMMDRRSK